eukprot:scaffold132351_cov45-Phaeocystis_antarctica.AAC.1
MAATISMRERSACRSVRPSTDLIRVRVRVKVRVRVSVKSSRGVTAGALPYEVGSGGAPG